MHGVERALSAGRRWRNRPRFLARHLSLRGAAGDEAIQSPETRFVFKVAIADRRIVRVDDDTVTFRYRHPHSARPRTMTLPVMEFLRRFLQHVLPSGFMKVRHFGFLSPSCAVSLEHIRARIVSGRSSARPARCRASWPLHRDPLGYETRAETLRARVDPSGLRRTARRASRPTRARWVCQIGSFAGNPQ